MSDEQQSNQSEDERRINPRVPIELKVEYRKLNSFFADYTKNISNGGTFIKTDKPLGIGTEFLFQLTLPTLPAPLEIKGEVVWIRNPEDVNPDNEEENEAGMGIKFIYDDDDQRREVEDMVAKMMIESLGERIYKNLLNENSES